MGLKKANKVNAEFNTSALTDIIFLLLIFFMLTSSIVQPNAINMKLPGSSRAKAPSKNKLDKILIRSGGRYFLNGKRITLDKLEGFLSRRAGTNYSIGIENANDASNGDVAPVLDIAVRLEINPVLLTDI